MPPEFEFTLTLTKQELAVLLCLIKLGTNVYADKGDSFLDTISADSFNSLALKLHGLTGKMDG